MFIKRTIYKRKKASAIKIQSVVRGWFARDLYAMMKEQKRIEEERKRQEEERKRQEEEARRSKEAEEAMKQAEKRRIEDERREKEKRQREEEEILALTRQALEVKHKMHESSSATPAGNDPLGDMFSFLDVVDKDTPADQRGFKKINDEIDQLYGAEADEYKKTVLNSPSSPFIPGAPAPPPVYVPPVQLLISFLPLLAIKKKKKTKYYRQTENIYENIRARKAEKEPKRVMKSNPLAKKVEAVMPIN